MGVREAKGTRILWKLNKPNISFLTVIHEGKVAQALLDEHILTFLRVTKRKGESGRRTPALLAAIAHEHARSGLLVDGLGLLPLQVEGGLAPDFPRFDGAALLVVVAVVHSVRLVRLLLLGCGDLDEKES